MSFALQTVWWCSGSGFFQVRVLCFPHREPGYLARLELIREHLESVLGGFQAAGRGVCLDPRFSFGWALETPCFSGRVDPAIKM